MKTTTMFRAKHYVVSGAANGIGKALVERLHSLGAVLSVCDADESGLSLLSSEIKGLYSEAFDLRDHSKLSSFIERAELKAGKVYGVINAAGITHIALAKNTNYLDYEKVINVNLLGTISLTQACLRSIIENKGVVVGISSVAGYSPLYYRTAYAASKHGVSGYLKSLQSELREDGVQVLRVYPAYVETELQKDFNEFQNKTGESMSPELVASKILLALEKGKESAFIGRTARIAYWLNKFSPGLYEKLMVKRTR